MRLLRHVITIKEPPDVVFDFFVDFTQASRWRSYVREMTPLEPGPVHAGSRIKVTLDLGGGPYVYELFVLALERPTLWRHHTNETYFKGHVEYRFEPDAGGTRVTMTMDAKPIGLYGWLALPLMLLRRNKPYAEQLPRLKAVMEGA